MRLASLTWIHAGVEDLGGSWSIWRSGVTGGGGGGGVISLILSSCCPII